MTEWAHLPHRQQRFWQPVVMQCHEGLLILPCLFPSPPNQPSLSSGLQGPTALLSSPCLQGECLLPAPRMGTATGQGNKGAPAPPPVPTEPEALS